MLEVFKKNFAKDTALSVDRDRNTPLSLVSGWTNLVDHLGGCSFNQGLYRVIRASDAGAWSARIAVAFPNFGGRITCFGFDWLGRMFAVDPERTENGQPGVVMFEPGTGEALEVPCNIASFHDEELIEYRDAVLASDFHRRWLNNGGVAPEYDQCIGYKKPLFLGGIDELESLELSDIEVYWHLMGQLIIEAKGLPPRTPISVSLS
ncbi:hypothetical protein ASE75_13640 [Sphingomonas sp. Leaf17]|uniref:T6SS immunity protein Tdi1 domain-containing protein n=1 Tax=Sphingomonas sp. Leaf17 TaxID=1735683 RepID=UPI0006F2C9CE|nr:T6SS immunity protein Tdi1 domain-containing protein [Sphingomonas sp. Leaf17]KQM63467.1 hypothetical protein ASE75_13640 [Sphingomonas sp. Leaf17]